MKAIVRKRQHRTLVDTRKAKLAFRVRGQIVDPEDIERWMRRHNVQKDELYVRSSRECNQRPRTIITLQLTRYSHTG